jgi:arsenite methyltransferase
MEAAQIKEMVRARYGGIAEATGDTSCCAPASSCCGDTAPGTPADKSRQMGYSDAELAAVPDGANLPGRRSVHKSVGRFATSETA